MIEVVHRSALLASRVVFIASRLARRLPPRIAAPVLARLAALQGAALALAMLADPAPDATTTALLRSLATSPYAPRRARTACRRRLAGAPPA